MRNSVRTRASASRATLGIGPHGGPYIVLIAALLLLGAPRAIAAEGASDWPQWRGPHFDGTSDAKNLPETLSKTDNLLWSTALPGVSNGTPILSGDRVFTSALDPDSRKLLAVCLDRKDGKILWQKEVGTGFIEKKGENNLATPSPVTDGKVVWFLFGTGDLAAFDAEGKLLWSRNLQKEHGSFNMQWLYGSSPLLYKGKLYVQVLHRETTYAGTALPEAAKVEGDAPSYLLAIDPASGKDLWKHVRPTDAPGEAKESYATPIPFEGAGRSEIVLVGGDVVTGHDPENGNELWRFGGWNTARRSDFRIIPSAVTGAGQIYACAPKGGPVMAIRGGGSGDVSKTHEAWSSEKKFTSDVCVPLFYRDRLYVLDTSAKKLLCVDPKTGEAKWSADLGGRAVFRASPTGADGKIYCVNANADVWVVAPDDGKVLSKASLDGKGARGSVAVADGIVVVRTGDTMYAFGKK